MYHCTSIITNKIVSTLQSIIDKNPEFYIDEIAEELVKHTKFYLPLLTTYKVLKEKLNYSLQICYKSAKEWNKLEQQYKAVLKSLVKNTGQVLVIDQVHKDKRPQDRGDY